MLTEGGQMPVAANFAGLNNPQEDHSSTTASTYSHLGDSRLPHSWPTDLCCE
jgi:hypothetical protein